MLVGGFDGYPNGVIVIEVTEEPAAVGQKMVHAVPRMYSEVGGTLLAELPFDSTAASEGEDSLAMVEEAIRTWVAFRGMTRV